MHTQTAAKDLEIDHKTSAHDLVVSRNDGRRVVCQRRAATIDLSPNIVALQTSVRIPVPVECQCQAFADTALNVTVVEVGPRKSQGDLPCAQSRADVAIARSDAEKVFKRFHTVNRAQSAVPRNVFPRQKIGERNVSAVQLNVAAGRSVTLKLDVHPLADHLQRSNV